jgi:cytochrome P450
MSQSCHTINAEPVQYTLFTRVFGATDSPELKKKLEDSWKDLLEPIERLFLNDAAAAAAIERGGIPQKVASFVTFSDNAERMKRWELSADIRVVTPELPGKPGVVEANLQSLARDFGACFAIPLLYGQDFLDRYPQLLDDFWKFDNDMFPLLMIGIPSWAPFKIMKEGLAARSRLLDEMEALYRRIDQAQRGEPVDADISDVSSAAFERNNVYKREKWSFRERAGGDLAIFWGQNANTHPVLFWLLAYIYSTPGLLDELRKEIAPYIRLSQTEPPEITSMDLPALSHNCQLIKACIFETYRMANEATSIRYVARPVTVNDGANKHELKPGMFVSAPHALIQRDPSVYADPDKFVPDRFLEADPESGKLSARYGRLKPWGSGAAMCKGRTFAEKEIVALSAAIMTLWNIGPASDTWNLPAMVPGTGVKRPVEDIRVVITRRAF